MIKADSLSVIIRPARGWSVINFQDLWRYRELIFFMTWRDIKVRYRQSVLGVGWVILQPFITMVVFSVFFNGLAKIPSEGSIPYPIFSYTALLPWGLFSRAMQDASRSLVTNSHMITKIYFPRAILPLASVLAGVFDFAVAFIVLLGMMIFYHVTPSASVWTLPLFLLLAVITSLGVSLWFSALNVLYRDVGYIMPFLTQIWMFLTPVINPASMVPEKWRLIYSLNPMTGVVEGFRWALLGTYAEPPLSMLLTSTGIALIILISGMFYFRRMERLFADMV